jgi:hypothetical protein
MRGGHGLGVFEKRVLRKIFGPMGTRQHGNGVDYITRNFMICTPHQNHVSINQKELDRRGMWYAWLERGWFGNVRKRDHS